MRTSTMNKDATDRRLHHGHLVAEVGEELGRLL
jgi:hypothetical protein